MKEAFDLILVLMVEQQHELSSLNSLELPLCSLFLLKFNLVSVLQRFRVDFALLHFLTKNGEIKSHKFQNIDNITFL